MHEDVLISTLTTMKIGGPAKYVRDITEPRQLSAAYAFAAENHLPIFILGGGSNTIGTDTGFSGLILRNKIRGIEIVRELAGEITISGGAGEILDKFIEFGTKRGYSGMEAMSAIPGTLGATPVQNVGAYGQEISDVLNSVEAYDTRTGRIVTLTADRLSLGYRRSIFNSGPTAGRYFITRVTVRLHRRNLQPPFYISLQRYIDEHKITDFSPASIRTIVTEIRSQKLPDPAVIPSAGSFFKNIVLKTDDEITDAKSKGINVWSDHGKNVINSGQLIELAGLKGQEFHGMRVSDKAALILINESAQSYADLAAARQHIIDTVQDKFGFRLQQEPIEIK